MKQQVNIAGLPGAVPPGTPVGTIVVPLLAGEPERAVDGAAAEIPVVAGEMALDVMGGPTPSYCAAMAATLLHKATAATITERSSAYVSAAYAWKDLGEAMSKNPAMRPPRPEGQDRD